jgi:hypothetical protein
MNLSKFNPVLAHVCGLEHDHIFERSTRIRTLVTLFCWWAVLCQRTTPTKANLNLSRRLTLSQSSPARLLTLATISNNRLLVPGTLLSDFFAPLDLKSCE